MKFFLPPLFLLVGSFPIATNAAIPKMLAEPAWSGKPLGPPAIQHSLSSRSATLIGECSPESPFQFELHGPSGVAAVGASEAAALTLTAEGAEAHLGTETQKFFGFDNAVSSGEDLVGYPLEYMVDGANLEGVTALFQCTVATPIVVIVKDSVDLEIRAAVTEASDGDEVEIQGNNRANGNLAGSTKPKKNSARSPVSFDSETNQKIKVKHEAGNRDSGVALVDGLFTSAEGYKVRRTLIHESKLKKDTFQNPRKVPVQCCDITDTGDVEIDFPGMLNRHESLRVDVRVGITLEGGSKPLEVVDVTGFLTQGNTITVHGGWIRNAIAAEGLEDTTEGWDVVVVNAVVSDPEDEYRVVGTMQQPNQNGLANSQAKKRSKLSQRPSSEEVSISEEMKIGKKPTREQRERHLGHSRRLNGGHKKILVHGYCSAGNPFPTAHFTNAIAFSDPEGGTGAANWSHNTFALKISQFATNSGLTGCGCIAHSQGGAACTHLYTNYWSCLDYPTTSGRKVQSVGTPYQGSALAGNLAAIGNVFGAGCGTNNDLTYSGASSWLSGIPSWARSQVTYYTTTFTDVWWRYDYCHLATDLFLSDPEDGATERSSGQLSGAVNGGHKEGWCHSTGMRDPPQYNDWSRNSAMDSNAQY